MLKNVTLQPSNELRKGPRMLRCAELGEMTGLTRKRIYELAKAGKIPCAKKTKGGQFYFEWRPALWGWIGYRRELNYDKQIRKGIYNSRKVSLTIKDIISFLRGTRSSGHGIEYHFFRVFRWFQTRPAGFWANEGTRRVWKDRLDSLQQLADILAPKR